jgi:acyl-CoA thioesterase-2
MGDLGIDTDVRALEEGCYEATLSQEWEIWGPMGGYVAACALRAAGAASPFDRPASFSCHYLNVAKFGPVQIRVEPRKSARTALSQRVEITQDDRAILDATVWSIGDVEGLEHDETTAPKIPGPDALPFIHELLPDDAEPPFPFWNNFDAKPLDFEIDWPPDGPRPARWSEWLRFRPTPTFADPWADAARLVILVDLPSWPSAHRPHAFKQPPFFAPTLDLNVAFHQPASDHEWLLCDGAAPLSTDGLFGWTSRVWSPAGGLLASGGGQCLYRRLRD